MSDLHNRHSVTSISVNTSAATNNNNNLTASEQELSRTKLSVTQNELSVREPLLVGIQVSRQEEDDKLAPPNKHHLHLQQQLVGSSSSGSERKSAASRQHQQQLSHQQRHFHQHHHNLSQHQYQSASHQHLQSLMSSSPMKQSSKSAISLLHGPSGSHSVALSLSADGQQVSKQQMPIDRSDSASLPSSTATSESMFKRRIG